jgi:hypothetical protein
MNDKQARIKRLKDISDELFNLANSFGGDETGIAAVEIHRSENLLNNAIRMLESGITLEDKKNAIRAFFDKSPLNANKSAEELEELVNMLVRPKPAKLETMDDFCGLPPGSFKAFIKEQEERDTYKPRRKVGA